jgi:hypothetical protein
MKSRLQVSLVVLIVLGQCAFARQQDGTKVAPQNPSPMEDETRAHERIENKEYPGIAFEIRDLFSKPVQLFVPQKSLRATAFDLLIHFHGAPYVTEFAATKYTGNIIAGTLSVGSGSKVYNDAFVDTTKFRTLVDSIVTETKKQLKHDVKLRRIFLSGFSAGYGAIRRIISSEWNFARVDGILLLDGFHTSYLPERKVLAEGGRIDSTGLLPYIRFAQDAAANKSRKKFLITHSEIFPGTFVSTTEATGSLLHTLSIKRKPVLKWGPLGMQQLSSSRRNHFAVHGFAGNTARDHVDHLQGLYWFLRELMKL